MAPDPREMLWGYADSGGEQVAQLAFAYREVARWSARLAMPASGGSSNRPPSAPAPELGRVGTWHLPAAEAAGESGLEWTILRPSSFASNTLSWADVIRSGQPVPNLTGTGSQGVIDPRDVAAVAAAALVTSDHSGHLYTLTAPALLTCADQVAILATVLGNPLDMVDVPEDVAREHMIFSGMSPEFGRWRASGPALRPCRRLRRPHRRCTPSPRPPTSQLRRIGRRPDLLLHHPPDQSAPWSPRTMSDFH